MTMSSTMATKLLAKENVVPTLALTLYKINKAMEAKTTKDEWKKPNPVKNDEFLDLFDEKLTSKLPPHHSYDHTISPLEGKEAPFGPLYSMSHDKLVSLKEYNEENLLKGFIRARSSSACAPVLFNKKGDSSLRRCVHYREINEMTVKNHYPLSLIKETPMRLSGAKWFTKLDLCGADNLAHMADREEWNAAFRSHFGRYEYLVMPFGLTNTPASFQHFNNDHLRELLDAFCMAYIVDILI